MGRKAIDETNNKYGKLTVIEKVGVDSHKHTIWSCRCDCGNIITAQVANLRNGHTTSCGCGRSNIDEIGNKYGKLIVIKKYGTDKFGKSLFECKCACGNSTIVRINSLRTGVTRSCGCLNSYAEFEIARILTNNEIKFIQQYTFEDLKSEKGYPLKFDFAVLDKEGNINYLIEYDGIQHFQNVPLFDKTTPLEVRISRDNIKNEYCTKNKIRLIRLSQKDDITLEKLL